MLGSTQLQLLDALESERTEESVLAIQPRHQHDDGQCLALIRSLAGDMPLRMAVAAPDDRPSVNGAAMRMRRFTRFYPQFVGVGLFDMTGAMIANSDFRTGTAPGGCKLFIPNIPRPSLGIAEDDALGALISIFGSDALLHADVKCPRGDATCGLLVARLR